MAITVADGVADWVLGSSGSSISGTSGTVTAAAGTLIVVCVMHDTNAGHTPTTDSVTATGLTFTRQVSRGDSEGTAGYCAIFTAPVSSSFSSTIAVNSTFGAGTSVNRGYGKAYVITGQHASPIGTTGEGSSTTNNLSPTLFTSTGAGRAFYCATDWNALGEPTSTDSEDGWHIASVCSGLAAYKATDHTASSSITGNIDGFGTSAADWNWVALEILADAGAAPTALPRRALDGPFYGPLRGSVR